MKRAIFLLFSASFLGACSPSLDQAPPDIILSIPTTYEDPKVIEIAVSATDDVGVTLLSLSRADDGKTFKTLKSVTTAPFAFDYTDTVTQSGTYTYRAIAEDASGKVRTTDQAVVVKLP